MSGGVSLSLPKDVVLPDLLRLTSRIFELKKSPYQEQVRIAGCSWFSQYASFSSLLVFAVCSCVDSYHL